MRLLCSMCLFFSFSFCYSQETSDLDQPFDAKSKISINNFDFDTYEETIRFLINKYRSQAGMELVQEKQVLKRAAYEQSSYMAEYQTLDQDDPGERAMLFGGTKKVEEIVGKSNVKAGGEYASYLESAELCVEKWMGSPKTKSFLLSPEYLFSGISATLSDDRKKIFIACMFGNYKSFSHNLGAKRDLYIGSKDYGLEGFHSKVCKKTQKVEDLHRWANGLYIENGIIYFEHDNAKEVMRIMREPDDGLAVDVVQKGQFLCDSFNIIDYNWLSKGILLKRVFSDDLKRNNIVAEGKSNRYVVALGEMPPLVDSVFELNLVVIQSRHVCADIKKSYVEIAPTRHFYKGYYYYFADMQYPDEDLPALAATDVAFEKKMCDRSINKWYRNEQNTYNCLLSKFFLYGMKSIVDYNDLMLLAEQLRSKNIIPDDQLLQLQIEASIKTLQIGEITEFEKNKIIEYLKEIDYSSENMNNTYAIAQLLINNKCFRQALKILDPYILDSVFDEELLFSHITLASLYPDRIHSDLFAKELQIAKKRNHDRYCELFREKLSFQLFENMQIKQDVCASCASQNNTE